MIKTSKESINVPENDRAQLAKDNLSTALKALNKAHWRAQRAYLLAERYGVSEADVEAIEVEAVCGDADGLV